MGEANMEKSAEFWFDHVKLDVYQESIEFVAWLTTLLEGSPRLGV